MTVQELVQQTTADPRYQELSFDEKIGVRTRLLSEVQNRDEGYRNAPVATQFEFDKRFMTDLGFTPENVVGDDAESNAIREIFFDTENVRSGGESNLNPWDGFVEGTRGYLSGKLGHGLVNLFTEGDTIDALFGSRRDGAERYRDYVYGKYRPEGLTDYKFGKIAGHTTGFVADALLAGGLYGSVGKAGLLTKSYASFSSKMLQQAGTKFGSKALTWVPLAIGQGSFEAAMYVGERALADKITGTLETDEDISIFMSNIGGTFRQGLAYFALGESLGAGIGSVLRNSKRVFTKMGWQSMTQKSLENKQIGELTAIMKDIISGNGDDMIKHRIKSLEGMGLPKKDIDNYLRGVLDAKEIGSSDSLMNDPKRFKELYWRSVYGIDAEVRGDAIVVKSVGGKDVPETVLATNTEMRKFLVENVEDLNNKILETATKLSSTRIGNVKVELSTVKGTTSTPIANDTILKTFRPDNKASDIKQVKKLLKKFTDHDIKIIQDDLYYANGKVIPLSKDSITIPKYINSGYKASKFADDFFRQVRNLTDNKIQFELGEVNTLLKRTGSIDYTKPFVEKLGGKNIKFNKVDGSWDLVDGKDLVKRFETTAEAGAYLHRQEFTDTGIANSIKKRYGYDLQNKKGAVELYDEKKKLVQTFPDMESIFKSDAYRPDRPYSKRPTFLAIKPSENVIKKQLFKNGTGEQLLENISKYEKKANTSLEGFTSKKGDITSDPKWMEYEVTLGDSGLSKKFDKIEDAKKWLETDMTKFENLSEAALEKGYRIQAINNGYYIYGGGKAEKQFAKSLKQAQSIIKANDDLRGVKDLYEGILSEGDIAITKGEVLRTQEYAEKTKADLKRKYAKAHVKVKPIREFLAKNLMPIRERLESLGDDRIIRMFDSLNGANKAFHTEYAQMKQVMNGIFHGQNKFKLSELQNMGKLLGDEFDLSSDFVFKRAADMKIELTKPMLSAMQSYRSVMDSAGARFGIDPATWQKNYSTRMQNRPPGDYDYLTRFDAMRAAKGEGKTTLDDEWFRYARSEDYIAGSYEDNLETMMDVYMRMGLRKQYFGGSLDELDVLLKDPNIDEQSRLLMIEASNKVNGQLYSTERAKETLTRLRQTHDMAEKAMAGEGKYKEMSYDERLLAAENIRQTDYNKFTSSLVTSALMAFKMKMPIRNISQVFSILQNLSGPDYVMRAFKKIDSLEDGRQIYKELQAKGIIKPRDVTDQYGPAMQKFLNKSNNVGMNFFYNSDDLTRMVSATSASERFKDGLALVNSKKMDMEGFGRFMQMDFLHESDKLFVTGLLEQKNFEAAESFFQRRWTDMTMFDYDLMNKPEGLTHGIGKIFGQYSTYPLSYMQFMKRGATQGTKAQGLAFVTKAAVSTAVVGTFYNDILNISGVNTNPWDTMFFTGGPMITSGAKILGTVNSNASLLNKSGSIVNEALKTAAPLYGIGASMFKGMEALKEAEYLDAGTRFLGATPAESSLVMDFLDL